MELFFRFWSDSSVQRVLMFVMIKSLKSRSLIGGISINVERAVLILLLRFVTSPISGVPFLKKKKKNPSPYLVNDVTGHPEIPFIAIHCSIQELFSLQEMRGGTDKCYRQDEGKSSECLRGRKLEEKKNMKDQTGPELGSWVSANRMCVNL